MSNEHSTNLDRYLSWTHVREISALSRTTVWRLQRSGDFPRAIRISPGRIAWRESEIYAWLAKDRPLTASAPPPPARRRTELPSETPADSVTPQSLTTSAERVAAAAHPVLPARQRRSPAPHAQLSFGF